MALLIGLACCAALLAAVGVYGVVTYSVARRTSEIGLRMALGAGAGDTFRLVVVGALRVAMAGVVLGVIGAAVLGKAIDSLLFGVPPLDFIDVRGGEPRSRGGRRCSQPAYRPRARRASTR